MIKQRHGKIVVEENLELVYHQFKKHGSGAYVSQIAKELNSNPASIWFAVQKLLKLNRLEKQGLKIIIESVNQKPGFNARFYKAI